MLIEGKLEISEYCIAFLQYQLSLVITAVLTGHGKTKAYLRQFHPSEEATCSCGHEDQTMDHILFHCANTSPQREVLIQ
jgi:hypothetical protein